VISKTSFENDWRATQMAAHAWTAMAHLAGVPYDTLLLEDVADHDLARHSAVILVRCSSVSTRVYQGLIRTLRNYLAAGGNIIVDGPIAASDEKGHARDPKELYAVLALENKGLHDNVGQRLRVAESSHYITRNFRPGEFLTQNLGGGLQILKFKSLSQLLVASTDGKTSYPYLSTTELNKNRLILISELGDARGAAGLFQNLEPRGFYPNRFFDVLIRSIYWVVYGDLKMPLPAPQLTNADLTAIVRLDADASADLRVQTKTIAYLIAVAKETGALPVYAWVSSRAMKAGWKALSGLGKGLQEVGGSVASHSRSHFLSRDVTGDLAKAELDGSTEEIESQMRTHGSSIGKIRVFVNPMVTIKMDSYSHIAERFSLFMTHGFEQQSALGYGSMSWFSRNSKKPLVVVNSTPMGDFQWFYDPEWSYTTAEATAYQEAIFEHMYHHISRGVLFNQMWHDYAVSSRYKKRYFDWLPFPKHRIRNADNRPLYDAMQRKFASHAIYFPDVDDLSNKMNAMAKWNYSWRFSKDRLEIRLSVPEDVRPFIGGMGIRIENTSNCIQSVVINGKRHYAFRDKLVILPNLSREENVIVISLGRVPSPDSRLTFVSKRMPMIQKTRDGLETTILTKSKGRVSFKVREPSILLNADWQEWNQNGDRILNGYVTTDRRLILKALGNPAFVVSKATVPVVGLRESREGLKFALDRPIESERSLAFSYPQPPQRVEFNGQPLTYLSHGYDYYVTLPEFTEKSELTIFLSGYNQTVAPRGERINSAMP
jgi:hypothetical protein